MRNAKFGVLHLDENDSQFQIVNRYLTGKPFDDSMLKSTAQIKKWTILSASFSCRAFMSTDEVLDALEKYTKESTET